MGKGAFLLAVLAVLAAPPGLNSASAESADPDPSGNQEAADDCGNCTAADASSNSASDGVPDNASGEQTQDGAAGADADPRSEAPESDSNESVHDTGSPHSTSNETDAPAPSNNDTTADADASDDTQPAPAAKDSGAEPQGFDALVCTFVAKLGMLDIELTSPCVVLNAMGINLGAIPLEGTEAAAETSGQEAGVPADDAVAAAAGNGTSSTANGEESRNRAPSDAVEAALDSTSNAPANVRRLIWVPREGPTANANTTDPEVVLENVTQRAFPTSSAGQVQSATLEQAAPPSLQPEPEARPETAGSFGPFQREPETLGAPAQYSSRPAAAAASQPAGPTRDESGVEESPRDAMPPGFSQIPDTTPRGLDPILLIGAVSISLGLVVFLNWGASIGNAIRILLTTITGWKGFTRLQSHKVLENPGRARILAAVNENPGVRVRRLAELCDLGRTATRYHLRVLQRHGLVQVRVDVSGVFVYASEGADVARPANPLHARLVDFVRANPGTNQSDLCAALQLQPSRAHRHLSHLLSQRILYSRRAGRFVYYHADPAPPSMLSAAPASFGARIRASA